MQALKVATLIEALNLVGEVYRNKDGSQPAEAVKKIVQQFDGAGEITLAEWVAAKQSKPKPAPPKRAAKPKPGKLTPDEALTRLQRAETHAALRSTVASLTLSAADWQTLAKRLTGRKGPSGPAARDAVETHLSDRLLLDERVESVKRQFH
jgi:hypothetical protein